MFLRRERMLQLCSSYGLSELPAVKLKYNKYSFSAYCAVLEAVLWKIITQIYSPSSPTSVSVLFLADETVKHDFGLMVGFHSRWSAVLGGEKQLHCLNVSADIKMCRLTSCPLQECDWRNVRSVSLALSSQKDHLQAQMNFWAVWGGNAWHGRNPH